MSREKHVVMKKYEVTVRLKKPYVLVDSFPKYPTRELCIENLIEALRHHELDNYLEIEIRLNEKDMRAKSV